MKGRRQIEELVEVRHDEAIDYVNLAMDTITDASEDHGDQMAKGFEVLLERIEALEKVVVELISRHPQMFKSEHWGLEDLIGDLFTQQSSLHKHKEEVKE